ncbi:MAG: tail fiber domain-containing protein, partial [Candidatus Heimdallarchaeota archaeon]
SGNTFSVAAGTGLVQNTSGLGLNHLGLQSLTGASTDKIMFWDQSANTLQWLGLGSNLSFSDTTLNSTNTQLSTEQVQTIVGGMIGTTTDIAVTYNGTKKELNYILDNVFVRKDKNDENNSFFNGSLVWNYTDANDVDHIYFNSTTKTFHLNKTSALGSAGNADVQCGTLTASGEVTAFSDIRLKENIRDIENPLDIVTKLKGVLYVRIEDKSERVGVIAQDVLKVLPEVVKLPHDKDGFYSVDYGKMNAVLIEAVKELKKENDNLKAEINEIKEMLKNIK